MNTLKSKRLALALALSGAVLPLTTVGCGGGGGGLLGSQQPTPTATPFATPAD